MGHVILKEFETNEAEFERYVGRKPQGDEMEKWAQYLSKGLDEQVDWKIACGCACDFFKTGVDE